MNKKYVSLIAAAAIGVLGTTTASARCNVDGISYSDFKEAVNTAYEETNSYGFGLPMWATLMNTSGTVCYVYSVKGSEGAQANGGKTSGNNAWLGSRVISAQKANTANQFSLDNLAISTGAISATVYPGGSLYGLQHSNPVDARYAYRGNFNTFGTKRDPLVGKRIGGVNVFGGGVALYDYEGVKVGAVGASGDTSCRDHTLAYRLRIALGLNNNPNDDGLSLQVPTGLFQQPACGVNDPTPTEAGSENDNGIRAFVPAAS